MRGAAWAWLLFVAGTLAGCVDDVDGHQEADLGGTSTIARESVAEAADGNGTVVGTILNKHGFALAEATVQLVEPGLFVDTDDKGNFTFERVPAGIHTLRVDKQTYKAFQEPLEVVAGERVRVEIVMALVDDVSPEDTEHIHDYWGPLDRIMIMDGPVDLSDQGTAGSGDVTYANLDGIGNYAWEFTLPATAAHPPPGAEGRAALIYPGTERVEVTITWTPDDFEVTDLMFGYDGPNADPEWFDPAPSGTVYEIPIVDPAMNDRGHSQVSRWEFMLRAQNNPTNLAGGDSYEPALADGSVHVNVEVIKGDVPLEPPHPRPWADGPCVQVRSFEDTGEAPNPAGIVPQRRPQDRFGTIAMGHGVVPIGATNMTISFQWTHERVGAMDAVPVNDWDVRFSTADQNLEDITLDDLRVPELVSEDLAAQTKTYVMEIEPGWHDPWYDTRSSWYIWPFDNTAGGAQDGFILSDWFLMQYNFYLDIVACDRDLMT